MKVDAAFELLVALSLTLMSSAASINLMLSTHLLVHRFSCCRSGPVSVDAALLLKQPSQASQADSPETLHSHWGKAATYLNEKEFK